MSVLRLAQRADNGIACAMCKGDVGHVTIVARFDPLPGD
jgi:hypothetical protein